MAKYCRFCGTQISESAAFCRRCGKPVKRQDVVQPKPAPLQRTGDPLPSAEIQPKTDVRSKSEAAAPSVPPAIEKRPKITSYAGSEKSRIPKQLPKLWLKTKPYPKRKETV